MKKKSYKKTDLNFFTLLLSVIVLDQVAKYLVKSNFLPNSSMNITSFFSLTFTQNTGVSFGLLKGYNSVFIVLSFIALGFFSYIYIKNKKYWTQLSLICAGIAGNLIDRLNFGYVIDLFDFHIWPVFNIADSAICIGIIWLIILAAKNNDELI